MHTIRYKRNYLTSLEIRGHKMSFLKDKINMDCIPDYHHPNNKLDLSQQHMVLAMVEKGWKNTAIARHFNVDPRTIYRIIKSFS
ncbi:helix-turn-helix domain-containing protein [Vibrio lentus]|uniref:helix-turn-helix domain-containing protein n=1 Tax=Vibrio lentus TaxID=136468 RepID=UPI003BAB1B7B